MNDQDAMETLRRMSLEGYQIRLSNKAAQGYWWAYCDGEVSQASDPAEAILKLSRKVRGFIR